MFKLSKVFYLIDKVNPEIIQLLPSSREAEAKLMAVRNYVDVIIPRGSQKLINSVRENAIIPVIETGAGIVHTYFDEFGDLDKGKAILFNAKTRRVSVCNALDCLIIYESRLDDLPELTKKLSEKKVVIFAYKKSQPTLAGKYPYQLLQKAEPDSFGTEFLSYKWPSKQWSIFKKP